MGGEIENGPHALSRSKRRGGQSDRSTPMGAPSSEPPDLSHFVEGAIQELSRRVGGSSFGVWWRHVGSGAPECLISQRPGSDPIEILGAELFAALA